MKKLLMDGEEYQVKNWWWEHDSHPTFGGFLSKRLAVRVTKAQAEELPRHGEWIDFGEFELVFNEEDFDLDITFYYKAKRKK